MTETLFYKADLRSFLNDRRVRMKKAIQSWDGDQFLQLSSDDVIEYVLDNYGIEPPKLDVESWYALPPEDAQIDVSQDFGFVSDRSRPAYVQGTRLAVKVPFSGDPQLFNTAPTTFTTVQPRADIVGSELVLSIEQIGLNADQAKSAVRTELERIEKYLSWVEKDVRSFEQQMKQELHQLVEQRRSKLLADRELEEGLGIPVRRRDEAPSPIPIKRKRVAISRPTATGSFKPEPKLSEDVNEEIIRLILNLGSGFERSPRTFAKLDEEELRDHILLQLNGTFEGQAGAEMFNGEGKTDVLVRIEDRNVFIGECKFWTGQKAFGKALDQLLGYLVWRDTKGALILFIKQKDVSTIIEKADAVIRDHANFKRTFKAEDPERRRDYVLHQFGDPNREIRLALLPMPIPDVRART